MFQIFQFNLLILNFHLNSLLNIARFIQVFVRHFSDLVVQIRFLLASLPVVRADPLAYSIHLIVRDKTSGHWDRLPGVVVADFAVVDFPKSIFS